MKPRSSERAIATSQQMFPGSSTPRARAPGDILLKLLAGHRSGAATVLADCRPCSGAQGDEEDRTRRKVSFARALAKAQSGTKFGPHDMWKQSPTDTDQML